MFWLLVIPALLIAALMLALLALWLIGERGHLMLPSTRRAITMRRARANGNRGAVGRGLHGYVYGRWAYQYIDFCINKMLPRIKSPALKRWWADHYHGKVLPTQLACEIIKLDHDIRRTDLDQIIPYPVARDLLLNASPNVTLFECPCRHARENPCTPTDVCMLVGGGDFALDHHPNRARRVSQQEALDVLQAEHERGHVHTAYFKDACDNRFYAICNCCKCCCGGLEGMVSHDVPMVASSGYVAQVDETACIACGDCETVCPFEAMKMNGKASVMWEKCMGCGVCRGRCEMEAVTLVLDERKGIPLDVRNIGVATPELAAASS